MRSPNPETPVRVALPAAHRRPRADRRRRVQRALAIARHRRPTSPHAPPDGRWGHSGRHTGGRGPAKPRIATDQPNRPTLSRAQQAFRVAATAQCATPPARPNYANHSRMQMPALGQGPPNRFSGIRLALKSTSSSRGDAAASEQLQLRRRGESRRRNPDKPLLVGPAAGGRLHVHFTAERAAPLAGTQMCSPGPAVTPLTVAPLVSDSRGHELATVWRSYSVAVSIARRALA